MATSVRAARQVSIQFSFTNAKLLPPKIREKKEETEAHGEARRQNSSGVVVIEPTERCSALGLPEALEANELVLVDAFCQKRPHKDPQKPPYWMVRFVYATTSSFHPNERFLSIREELKRDLRRLLSDYWRIRAYDNPYYENGAETKNERVLSINLELRVVPSENQKASATLVIENGEPKLTK